MNEKRIVCIGSTVVDIILKVPQLPKTSQDVNLLQQSFSLGGCAFNVAWMCHLFHAPYLLFSPVGSGLYGDFIRTQMQKLGLASPLLQCDEANGCCYCFVEPQGERTFLSYQGSEYRFKKEWFALLDHYDIAALYVCGLEIEAESGNQIIDYMERYTQGELFFAPGPRVQHIEAVKLNRIFACSPILHLNQEEAFQLSSCNTLEAAAQHLNSYTKNCIIITLGAKGAYLFEKGKGIHIPGNKVQQIDTIGAGDAHIGAILAAHHQGDNFYTAIQKANQVAQQIVKRQGALLTKEEFESLHFL